MEEGDQREVDERQKKKVEGHQKQEADERFDRALEREGARDPRAYLRERMRELKEANPGAYEEAAAHYGDVLVPAVASGQADPILAWREFARRIAALAAPGETMAIDRTGAAATYAEDAPKDRLVLHFPKTESARPLLVALPPEPSPAQRATYDLLVRGARRLG